MAGDLISKKTRQLFREYFVGWTLATIADEFDAADVPVDLEYEPPISGARRSLVEQYYHAVDFARWEDVRKVLTVYENVLVHLETEIENPPSYAPEPEYPRKEFAKLTKALARDGFEYQEGRLRAVGRLEPHLEEVAARFDLPELLRQIERMRNAVDSDPDLAIGTAKEVVETTCKTILGERGVALDSAWEVPALIRETRKALSLLPDDIPDATKGADVIRRLLSNLGTVGQGLAELRNLYGTGHGKDGRQRQLPARLAKLAVGASAALAVFLLETHQARGGGSR